MSEIDTIFSWNPENSEWEKATDFPIPNRAMNFGDGIFETLVFDGSKIRFFDFHRDRLFGGIEVLKMDAEGTVFLRLEKWLLNNFGGKKLRVRLNIFRAGSGKYTPEIDLTHQTLHVQDLTFPPKVKRTSSFSEGVALFPYPWSRFKTLNSLPYVMAAKERIERDLDELILLDYSGKVAEASAATIFWRKGKKVFTPALTCGGIDGIGRRAILTKIPRLINEGVFSPNDLLRADQVWVSNVTGISYLEKVDSLEFSTEEWEPLSGIFE
ncbi:aminotransferase class IV [Algoriphagus boritolerans]|uniref:branched-chain-amino-acid transaminase n=1 Tax=Algoriphagus boritolerans DSM 17298 = JCM 18970 TaxID=1120964 RepID=A0A1H5TYL0_9BACT|nr:aminotransferase class IV [Algoriphagus boritolerans]SEF67873.1 branched-chain amino acid aminotransferase [Algoriphagus boritolerans DSM 17298 = JCM 18970]